MTLLHAPAFGGPRIETTKSPSLVVADSHLSDHETLEIEGATPTLYVRLHIWMFFVKPTRIILLLLSVQVTPSSDTFLPQCIAPRQEGTQNI